MYKDSGLTIVRLARFGGAPEVLADMTAKCLATVVVLFMESTLRLAA